MNSLDAMRILGLTDNYTEEQLRKSYRKLSAKNHPDVAGEEATEKFIEINKAYDLLSKNRKNSSNSLFTHQSIFNIVPQS